jgi:hypothetical protein
VLPAGQKLTLGLLATITLKIHPFVLSLFIPLIKHIDAGRVKLKYSLIDAVIIQKHHNKTITRGIFVIITLCTKT